MPSSPEVLGPLVGDRPPWGVPRQDVSKLGYIVEEYFLEGLANAYQSADASPSPDGRWEAVEFGQAQYRTRILVVRPLDPTRFNGTVLLNWQNVSGGVEPSAPSSGETYDGYAWVGVSAQEIGIFGFPLGMRGSGSQRTQALVDHDPARYGPLEHPGDQGSFDIFAGAAMAVGPNRGLSVDPLGGLDVQRVIATGASQSAMRLTTYLNAVHALSPVIDGFVLAVWEGRAPRLEEGSVAFGLRTAIRDDLKVPVLVVNSEFETLGVHHAGANDSAMVRIWEVAGAPHAVSRGRPSAEAGTWGPNPLSIQPIFDAAVRQVHHWTGGGVTAPSQPRIEVEEASRPAIRRDLHGNAVGGIRLPEVAAPTAEYRGMSFGTGLPPLFGASRRFSDDRLRAMYSSRAEYLERWSSAVDALVASGALRPEDAPAMLARRDDVALPVE
jgi:hypothetical protein